jgi:hypothetical protein
VIKIWQAIIRPFNSSIIDSGFDLPRDDAGVAGAMTEARRSYNYGDAANATRPHPSKTSMWV